VKTIMAGMGLAMMGTGIAEGPDRAMEAARRAISSPLLEGASVNGSRGVIINVTGGPDLSLVEVSEASSIVQEAAHEDANIIFGAVWIGDGGRKSRSPRAPAAAGAGSASDTPVDLRTTPRADGGREYPAARSVVRRAATAADRTPAAARAAFRHRGAGRKQNHG
jgi:cell division protein FtsZ